MSETADLLVEIGTEELPPKALRGLSLAFANGVQDGLKQAGLEHAEVVPYATPRRLAVLVSDLVAGQAERQLERRGPAVKVAFDEQGEPTRAASGFAASCGVEVEQLERQETDQGSWLVFRSTEMGQATTSLVPAIVEKALADLPVPKRMRWGSGETEFVRPVHWVVLLYGETVIEAEILGVSAGRQTLGHRFHHPNAISLEQPSAYALQLYGSAYVVADFDTRRSMVRKQAEAAAQELGGKAIINDALLDEVTALVEWPVAVSGGFDEEYLELPDPVLIATMQGNQKYFPVVDESGKLQAHFITISNIESSNPDAVRSGNERVIRPRLSDAQFFYRNDLRHSLEERLEGLKQVVFQKDLGSLFDKACRVSRLAAHIAIAMGEAPEAVELAKRAGRLCKCDLLSEMVGEFPELQGTMGRYYAIAGGEPEAVALALEASYAPRFAGAAVPVSATSQAVAMADKLDTLVGIFGIGQIPSGAKDPFALRRAALGVLRIMIEGQLNLDLPKLLDAAVAEYPEAIDGAVVEPVFTFMNERLRAYFLERGILPDVFEAVQARHPERPYDFARRVQAVEAFRKLPEGEALSAANKRIGNILKKADGERAEQVDDALFGEDAEWNLAAKLIGLTPQVKKLLQTGDYSGALTRLASLREAVDDFFDHVQVMAENPAVQQNRLAMLNNIHGLFLQTADISRLQF